MRRTEQGGDAAERARRCGRLVGEKVAAALVIAGSVAVGACVGLVGIALGAATGAAGTLPRLRRAARAFRESYSR